MLSCVCVDKLRNGAMRDAAADYVKRLKRYVRFDEREVKPARGNRPVEELQGKESGRLLEAVPPGAVLVALDPQGSSMDSLAFAGYVRRHVELGQRLCFAIGGAHGHHSTLLARANKNLAIAPWTLPHELARVVLYEQLYRAMTIMRGEPYHK